jgi:hypothetical protein
MSQATALAFVLGAVAGFVSILLGRMTTVLDRIRSLNEIAVNDAAPVPAQVRYSALAAAGQTPQQCNTFGTSQRDVRVAAPRRGICERVPQAAPRIRSWPSFSNRGCSAGWVALQIRSGCVAKFKFSQRVPGVGGALPRRVQTV